jgi:cation diffusion facilitator family transporter
VLGLAVNVICAVILNTGTHSHSHHHHEHGPHAHHHQHDDLNLKSAYLHVVADALTSLLAIAALLGAKCCGWSWLDPAVGIAGALLILRWAAFLLRDSAAILLDHEKDSPVAQEIKENIESDGDTKISDLHIWKVADGKYACILAVVTGRQRKIEEYRKRLESVHELAHTTIEIIHCPGGPGCSGDHDGKPK